jgi:tetratricopeptide (TPR) repeat protein
MDDQVMWQRALTRSQSDAASDPENAFFWFNLGTNYNALGDYQSAAAAFDQARAIGLPWRMLWYQFGPYEAYYQTGRYEDVILLADVTLKDRPYFEESFYYKGLAQEALGNIDAARANYQEAAEFNPNFALAVAALSQLESN